MHKTWIIFHSGDLDGQTSGALLRYKFMDSNIEMVGLDYGNKFNERKICKNDSVFLLDFSLQPFERVRNLKDKVKQLTVIDHHRDFVNYCLNNEINISYGKDNESACLVAWNRYFSNKVPPLIQLLSDYDVWNDKDKDYFENVVLPFQYAMRSENTNPISSEGWNFWQQIFTILNNKDNNNKIYLFINDMVKKGKIILKYLNKYYSDFMKNYAFDAEIDGLKAIVVNGDRGSLQFQNVWDPDKYDLMVSFRNIKNEYWSVSFYTYKEDVDCAKIARKFGGSGHKGAAGCQVNDIKLIIK